MKKEFTENMKEISGMGGGYEKACRKMVEAGLEWLDQNPNADLSWKEFKGIYGITTEESEDVKKLEKVMLEAAGGCSGAMMQACLNHVLFVKNNGWEKYKEEMSNQPA